MVMKPCATWSRGLVLGAFVAVLAAGCSAPTRQTLVRVFFTGVDRPGVAVPAPPAAAVTNNLIPARTVAPAPILFVHQPYDERKCDACHLSKQSEQLKREEPGLCLECHPQLGGEAKFAHAPFSAGRCSLCHEAHQAEEKKLLTRKAQELCQVCHKPSLMRLVSRHAAAGDAACVTCHDPHRSNQKALVKANP